MTPTITREELGAIARAMGKCLHPEDKLEHSYGNWGCDTTCGVCGKDPSYSRWNPAPGGNPADTFAMCCEREVDITWVGGHVAAQIVLAGGYYRQLCSALLEDFPSKQAAAAYASCKVVAAVQLEKEKQG